MQRRRYVNRQRELARLTKAAREKERLLTAARKKKGRRGRLKIEIPAPYRSWFEVDIALDALKRDIEFDYEKEHIIWKEPEKLRKYKPDFFVKRKKDGSLLVIEAKGRWTADDRKKICYVTEQNPKLDLRMLFERDNTLSKSPNSKHYSEWCDRKGIKWAVGRSIPQEWMDE
jgi:hypothetical protein